ncbi:putative iron-regulated protein [Rhizobium sp. BK181]|uniref:imelysin family protein n=1 Tax=Rhizobium sp. BK181 TaxID=2587072 RepID=UPI001614FE27|nr:imelysin family protein [Rhizobium sp. BK181]MBB3315375.1 putative iron-regulated protein [Rhizobium sp. BK181]
MKLNKNFCAAVALAVAPTALLAIPAYAAPDAAAVVKHYADVAHAKYEDSLTTAKALDAAIDVLLKDPTDKTLKAARAAWIKARIPYQQTEVYRFGNPIVDDWEGKVNAWPLDEGLIDYVDASYGTESDENSLYVANVIANKTIKIDGKDVDASKLTPEFLSGTLAEAGGVEANVATGYHAIEFLLWGQDLNGTGPGAGNRPATDYDLKNCTHGNCDRRAEYLKSASTLLVSDLQEMTDNWTADGEATKHVEADPKAGLVAILTGMGSLSYGELAGERMKLGLLLHDPEEEHDCFSDNTFNSHLNDAIGIAAAYTGDYTRVDGTKMKGPSLHDLVVAKDEKLDKEMQAKLKKTLDAMQVMAKRGLNVEKYDQMIGEGNKKGNAVVQAAIDGLVDQTKTVQRVIAALDLGTVKLEGSDSLDNPGAVFQ